MVVQGPCLHASQHAAGAFSHPHCALQQGAASSMSQILHPHQLQLANPAAISKCLAGLAQHLKTELFSKLY